MYTITVVNFHYHLLTGKQVSQGMNIYILLITLNESCTRSFRLRAACVHVMAMIFASLVKR